MYNTIGICRHGTARSPILSTPASPSRGPPSTANIRLAGHRSPHTPCTSAKSLSAGFQRNTNGLRKISAAAAKVLRYSLSRSLAIRQWEACARSPSLISQAGGIKTRRPTRLDKYRENQRRSISSTSAGRPRKSRRTKYKFARDKKSNNVLARQFYVREKSMLIFTRWINMHFIHT